MQPDIRSDVHEEDIKRLGNSEPPKENMPIRTELELRRGTLGRNMLRLGRVVRSLSERIPNKGPLREKPVPLKKTKK